MRLTELELAAMNLYIDQADEEEYVAWDHLSPTERRHWRRRVLELTAEGTSDT